MNEEFYFLFSASFNVLSKFSLKKITVVSSMVFVKSYQCSTNLRDTVG